MLSQFLRISNDIICDIGNYTVTSAIWDDLRTGISISFHMIIIFCKEIDTIFRFLVWIKVLPSCLTLK